MTQLEFSILCNGLKYLNQCEEDTTLMTPEKANTSVCLRVSEKEKNTPGESQYSRKTITNLRH